MFCRREEENGAFLLTDKEMLGEQPQEVRKEGPGMGSGLGDQSHAGPRGGPSPSGRPSGASAFALQVATGLEPSIPGVISESPTAHYTTASKPHDKELGQRKRLYSEKYRIQVSLLGGGGNRRILRSGGY